MTEEMYEVLIRLRDNTEVNIMVSGDSEVTAAMRAGRNLMMRDGKKGHVVLAIRSARKKERSEHMTYITNVPREVQDEVEHITQALPGKVYYSDDGEALILADEGKYIVSVEPPSVILPGFNNGNCTTHSAYLITQPAVNLVEANSFYATDDLPELEGWETGWEC